MRHFIWSILAVSVLASCVRSAEIIGIREISGWENPAGDKVRVSFSFGGSFTKSSIPGGEDDILEVKVLAFHDGILAGCAYSDSRKSVSMELKPGVKYNVYALANVGSGTEYSDENDFLSEPLLTDDWTEIKAVPMAGSEFGVEIGNDPVTIEIGMERLVSKIRLNVEKQFHSGNYVITGATVRQNASEVFPFAPGILSDSYIDGDFASEAELDGLNDGDSWEFYVNENLQGILLPGNTDPWTKVPENISVSASRCTYLEICGEWECDGISAPLTYRLYLGEDNCRDFNVIRNVERTITLSLTDQGVNASSWKVEKGSETDNRVMRFKSSALTLLPDGRQTTCLIETEPAGLPFEVWIDDKILSDNYIDMDVTDDAVQLSLNSNPDSDLEFEIRLLSSDGSVKDRLPVTAKHAEISVPFGVRIGESQNYVLNPVLIPPQSETGWPVRVLSSMESVISVDETDPLHLSGLASGHAGLFVEYGPCDAEMDAIVEKQDGFVYSGLPGYVYGADQLVATVSPHLQDNLFSAIYLESNTNPNVLKVERTQISQRFLEQYSEYAPDYGTIFSESAFKITPVGPGETELCFRSDYPCCTRTRVVTVVPVEGYYLNMRVSNSRTGETFSRGPANAPAAFRFQAQNSDVMTIRIEPEIRGAFIENVKVSSLIRTVSHPDWTEADYYSMEMKGSHLNDCEWTLTGKDCKVEVQVTFGLNRQTVTSTFEFSE